MSELSPVWLIANDRPLAGDAAGRLHLALHQLHRRVEHLHVGDADRLHAEALGERPAGVVVRPRLRVVRRPVLVVEQRVGDARVGLVHPDDVAARRELARRPVRASRRLLAVAAGDGRLARRSLAAEPPVASRGRRRRRPPRPARPRPPAAPPAAGRAGIVTVNAAVALEISTPCFCSTRSSSACVPRRGSLAGSTYAAGPSTFGFITDRLLLS